MTTENVNENALKTLQALDALLKKVTEKVAIVQAHRDGKLSFEDTVKQVNALDE